MISLDNLTVSYGGWTLFDNISLLINPKDRIGLVGKNGAGKTTLLRLIVGEQQPTSGSISYNGECTIGYLPQQMRVADTTTLVEETAKAFDEVLKLEAEIARLTREIAERTDYESSDYESLLHRLNEATDHYHILGGDTREADIEKTLLGLGFKRSDFQRATSEFSGGWSAVCDLIGTLKFNIGIGTLTLFPMVFATIFGGLLGPDAFKLFKTEESKLGGSLVLVALAPFMAKMGISAGGNLAKLVAVGPALLLQEFGNLGTILLSLPLALLLGLKKEAIGACYSINRDSNL